MGSGQGAKFSSPCGDRTTFDDYGTPNFPFSPPYGDKLQASALVMMAFLNS